MPPRIWKVRYLRLVRKVHRLIRHRRLRRFEWWNGIRARILNRALWHPCRDTVAGGMAIGFFFAMMPMPMQTIAAALVAVRAKVNIPFAVAACFVSNPLTEVFIRISQHKLGLWLRDSLSVPMPKLGEVYVPLGGATVCLDVSAFILGFLVAGIILAFIAYPLVHVFSAILPETLPIRPPALRRKKARKPAN